MHDPDLKTLRSRRPLVAKNWPNLIDDFVERRRRFRIACVGRHLGGVFARSLLRRMERCEKLKDRLAVLPSNRPAGAECSPITHQINHVFNWLLAITSPQEIGMNRMQLTARLDSSVYRSDTLAEQVAAVEAKIDLA